MIYSQEITMYHVVHTYDIQNIYTTIYSPLQLYITLQLNIYVTLKFDKEVLIIFSRTIPLQRTENILTNTAGFHFLPVSLFGHSKRKERKEKKRKERKAERKKGRKKKKKNPWMPCEGRSRDLGEAYIQEIETCSTGSLPLDMRIFWTS